jgi:hypothetical protein
MEKLGPQSAPLACPVIDPRLLGLVIVSSPNLAQSHFEEYVGAADRSPPSIKKTNWNGKDCLRIDYSFLGGNSKVRMWVAPDRGPSIVRMEIESRGRGKHLVDTVECEFAAPHRSGYWYPTSCVYERKIDGKTTERELVTVEILSLNEALPTEVFKIAGMGIPKGTPVTGLPNARGSRSWDGETAVPLPKTQPEPEAAAPDWKRRLLLGTSVACAGFAGFFIWRALLRKRQV